ncbi:hypothetical protein ACFXGA_20335 [Actinosynnema sp. NPDC059335]|uniref:hypothetical protein n=1 Tax=Actinosynnema sp. NPDC059335 TaxID=3346804 RepID=UPI0036712785
MVVAEIFGWIGGTIGAAVAWPQAWRLWVGRKFQGLSPSAGVLAVFYGVGWTAYGLWTQSPAQIVTNAIALTASVAVLAGHVRLGQLAARQWLPLLVATLGGLALIGLLAGGTAVGSVVGASTIFAIGAQVVSLIRQRARGDFDVRGVSRPRWWLSAFCNAMWMVFGILALDWVVLVTSSTNTVLSLAVLALTLPPRGRASTPVEQVEAAA